MWCSCSSSASRQLLLLAGEVDHFLAPYDDNDDDDGDDDGGDDDGNISMF